MTSLLPVNRYMGAVWRRHLLVWRELFWPSLATNVANPVLFLFAFGFGMGAVIHEVGGLNYLAFIVPGMMAYAAMFAASFEATVSAFSRYQMQRTWDALMATPVSLREMLFAEALWATTKAMFSAICVLAVAMLWDGVPSPLGALVSLIPLAIVSFALSCCGLWATVYAKSWEFFSYFFTFWITPMFVFSGVFFEVTRFPGYIQWVAWLLPMTHLIAVMRPLVTGTPLDPLMAILHIAYPAALGLLAFWMAQRKLAARMFD